MDQTYIEPDEIMMTAVRQLAPRMKVQGDGNGIVFYICGNPEFRYELIEGGLTNDAWNDCTEIIAKAGFWIPDEDEPVVAMAYWILKYVGDPYAETKREQLIERQEEYLAEVEREERENRQRFLDSQDPWSCMDRTIRY